MAHTPGPWYVGASGVTVYAGEGEFHIVAQQSTNIPAEQRAANARLIAAAPDLLAACERAKGFIDSWGKKLGDWDVVDQNAINAIEAAIAKAKGGD